MAPSWVQTIGAERPWSATRPPSTLQIPFTEWAPEQIFHADAFHVVKLGIARHFCGSALVALVQWGYIPCNTRNVQDMLAAAYGDFRQACQQMRLCPNVKSFTRDILHWSKNAVFPWGGWTLGICVGKDWFQGNFAMPFKKNIFSF